MSAEILVIGYGNTLRGDDGIGATVVERVIAMGTPGVRVIAVHQLTPELAADLADVRFAVFVDASVGGEPVAVVRIAAETSGAPMTHAADPRGLLALCTAVYRKCPAAWLVTAAGVDFGFREGLSPAGRVNARAASAAVEQLIREATGA